jgi:hypothetical protein
MIGVTRAGLLFFRFLTAAWACASVAKGPSVPAKFGAGSLPLQESFPVVATKKSAETVPVVVERVELAEVEVRVEDDARVEECEIEDVVVVPSGGFPRN